MLPPHLTRPGALEGVNYMPGLAHSTSVEILLVEDTEEDAELMVDALKEGRLVYNLALVDDGEKAIAYLRREGAYAMAPRPDLILLDLGLPRKSGREVLAEIKQDATLRRIPVVIMTSSDSETAFMDAYDLHANCCVSKPMDQGQFEQAVKKIEYFWLHVARFK